MSDAVLTVLKFCLLALLYLFLLRVVLIVARELRGTPAPAAVTPASATVAGDRGSHGKRSWRLVVVEPKAEQGQAYRDRRRSNARPRRRVRDTAHLRHVRVAGARARVRPRREPVGRGRRFDATAPS